MYNQLREDFPIEIAKAKQFDFEAMKFAVRHGADVNINDADGKTPLHHVLSSPDCSAEVVQFLLELGADVNKVDTNGNTPFMMSILRKEEESDYKKQCCIKYLTETNATVPIYKSPTHSNEIIRKLLYFNPRADIQSDVLNLALRIYQNSLVLPPDPAFSLFAVLLELGFDNLDKTKLEHRCVGIRNYYNMFIHKPMSLQSLCCLRIRRTFPGFALHRFVRMLQIPKGIQDLILCEKTIKRLLL
ncbi:ankyrin repeat and SOCS box protein 2-like [Mercenaria mercenaria]|uniref:ankyrin repeat and SOCS box protein 2-like n=1 Tax=Mercenaria mercenaria TaxID=6596 RepID=UPI00234E38C2|nr:ankyrin repeat and SOCS box protein 2-like [Mercenaria mercenaria]